MTQGPRVIAFELTRKCRFSCVHCRASAQSDSAAIQLDTNQCKRILESIAKVSKPLIIMTGGEPLERPDFFELTEYARELGLPTALATCGYLIDELTVKKIKSAGIGAISFSIDGATAKTHDKFRRTSGAFAAVMNAAELVRVAGIRFQVNTTVTRDNAGEIEAIADLAAKMGACCFNAFILVPTGRGEAIQNQLLTGHEYDSVLRRLVELKLKGGIDVRVTCGPQFARLARQERLADAHSVKGCLGGRQFGFISYKGDVQMCGFMPVSAGNLDGNGFDFAAIWNDSTFLNEIRQTDRYKGACGECEFVGICGGCRARSYSVLSDYMAGDPVCDYAPRSKK
jgi:radical SAM protein with 4Fe4S-binding SPASM domain